MMKLYKAQLMLLLSKKDLNVLLGSLLIVLIFLLYASGFYYEYNYQVVNSRMLFREYIIESVSFIKFTIVLFGVYLSILVRKLHFLDGLLLSRGSRIGIITSRVLVLLTYVFVINSILYVFFLTVGSYLTPIMMDYDYLRLFIGIQLFGIFYMMLSYLFMLTTKVFYAPIFTLLLYFIGTIFSPFYVSYQEVSMVEKVVNFVTNDLIVFSDYSIAPYYGNLHLTVMITVLVIIIISSYLENDITIL